MKLIPKLCFGLGVTAGIAGLGAILAAIADVAWAQRPLFQAAAQAGKSVASSWVRIDDPAARVGLGLTIVPHFTTQRIGLPQTAEAVDLYRFPLHYRVRDDSGQLLIDQWVMLDATQDQALQPDRLERPHARPVRLDAVFDAFPVASGGRIQVEALLLPDQRYGAELEEAELRLFRQPPPVTVPVRAGVAGLLMGLALLLLGLLAELWQPAPQVRRFRSARILVFPVSRRLSPPLPAAEEVRRAL